MSNGATSISAYREIQPLVTCASSIRTGALCRWLLESIASWVGKRNIFETLQRVLPIAPLAQPQLPERDRTGGNQVLDTCSGRVLRWVELTVAFAPIAGFEPSHINRVLNAKAHASERLILCRFARVELGRNCFLFEVSSHRYLEGPAGNVPPTKALLSSLISLRTLYMRPELA
jgi:hypothetical protein